ncbi:prepilin peptidase [Trinickia mobilis]|uniref:prepilin peptidase n=1 Tax=Trinickia mobilis TaxID=2816356 RepID=UPI001A8CA792|nr:A24 family peptidase [Trinickia mobilis]
MVLHSAGIGGDALIAALGLAIGSFLNVVVYRLPRIVRLKALGRRPEFSLVRPRSGCPKCGHDLAAWENVPVLSFVLLGGKCRACGNAISWRYPIIETGTGFVFLGAYALFGLTALWLWATVLGALLILWAGLIIEGEGVPLSVQMSFMLAGVAYSVQSARGAWPSALACAGLYLLVLAVSRHIARGQAADSLARGAIWPLLICAAPWLDLHWIVAVGVFRVALFVLRRLMRGKSEFDLTKVAGTVACVAILGCFVAMNVDLRSQF